MLSDWQFIGIFVALAAIFPGAPILIARFISPRKPNPIKQQTYECGIETVGDAWVQFKVQYYIYALVFLVFDIEIVFLLPWALAFDQISGFGVFAGLLFIFLLVDGLLYAWARGALEWY
jgi:NADH:ubiquinone oxidoreductase subunit 3 (subunit A)